MRHLDFHFDVISPYAYLAFHALPQALQGHSVTVTYRPLVLGAVLQQLGQLGPAEIPGKRDWTYQHVLWLARERGLPMKMPSAHPFNSLALLRLGAACDPNGTPNRHVVGRLFDHVWTTGEDAACPERLAQLSAELKPVRDPQSDEVKQSVRAHTEAALQAGVFGTPTVVVDGHRFWGDDALPLLSAYLSGDPWFTQPEWLSAGDVPWGIRRKPSN